MTAPLTAQKPAAAPKQLKKQDFLNAVTEAPMTREQLVEALADFSFIGSYLDYLTDHFQAQGKIVRLENGGIQRKSRKVAQSASEIHRVKYDEQGVPSIETRHVEKGEVIPKEEGYSLTKNRAIKVAGQAVFADYKAKMDKLKELSATLEPAKANAEVAKATPKAETKPAVASKKK